MLGPARHPPAQGSGPEAGGAGRRRSRPASLSRVWQMLLKAHEEVRRAPDPGRRGGDGPRPPGLRRRPARPGGGAEDAAVAANPCRAAARVRPRRAAAAAAAAPAHRSRRVRAPQAEPLPDPQTFDQTVALIGEKRDIGLQMDVERYVRPIAFKPGAITFEPVPGAPARSGPAAGLAAEGMDRPHLADRRQRPGRRRDPDRARPAREGRGAPGDPG